MYISRSPWLISLLIEKLLVHMRYHILFFSFLTFRGTGTEAAAAAPNCFLSNPLIQEELSNSSTRHFSLYYTEPSKLYSAETEKEKKEEEVEAKPPSPEQQPPPDKSQAAAATSVLSRGKERGLCLAIKGQTTKSKEEKGGRRREGAAAVEIPIFVCQIEAEGAWRTEEKEEEDDGDEAREEKQRERGRRRSVYFCVEREEKKKKIDS